MLIKIGARPDHAFDEPLGLLSDCHRRIEHFLETLVRAVDAPNDGALDRRQQADVETALTYFAKAAPKHTADEEQSLFPRLRASRDPEARAAVETVDRLERDHMVADTHHRAVDSLFRQWIAEHRLDAASRGELREHLADLTAIYRAHIAVEDRELFPVAGRLLSRDELAAVGREMSARRKPA